MQFKPSDYQRLAIGIDHATFADGAWQPQRISDNMRPIYNENKSQITRRMCTADIGLRFVSNTRSIELRWRTHHPARLRYQGSVIVDGGEPTAIGSADKDGEWAGVIFTQAGNDVHTFDICLPHTCRAEIMAIEIDDGSSLEAAPPHNKRWLVYGDSITQGMDATLPTDAVVSRVARALDVQAVNLGIGGAILDARLAATVPDIVFDFASIAYGANDLGRNIPIDQYAANARNLAAALAARNPDAPVLLITPLTWVGQERKPNEAGATLDDYRRSLQSVADELSHVHLVDGKSLIPEDDALFADGVHPNDAGFAVYAANLLPHLQRIV